VLGWLAGGEDLALVSDAGTPLVSDPGRRVVAAAVEAGHTVVPIPGPRRCWLPWWPRGYPPIDSPSWDSLRAKVPERAELLERIAVSPDTSVVFESPERTGALLHALAGRSAGPDRRAALARELTKVHEEIARGTLGELGGRFAEAPPRGEVTVVVEGAPPGEVTEEADEAAAQALAAGAPGRRDGPQPGGQGGGPEVEAFQEPGLPGGAGAAGGSVRRTDDGEGGA
jgi:16S rRNA (cytidine1402-2'-O)-methyltransferase